MKGHLTLVLQFKKTNQNKTKPPFTELHDVFTNDSANKNSSAICRIEITFGM